MPISIPLMQRRSSGKDLAGDSGGRGDLFVPPHMLSRQVRSFLAVPCTPRCCSTARANWASCTDWWPAAILACSCCCCQPASMLCCCAVQEGEESEQAELGPSASVGGLGLSPTTAAKRERLLARNAILRSTGFIEVQHSAAVIGAAGGRLLRCTACTWLNRVRCMQCQQARHAAGPFSHALARTGCRLRSPMLPSPGALTLPSSHPAPNRLNVQARCWTP